MSKAISGLPFADALDGSELVPVVQNGDTVQASADQFAQLVGTLTTAGVALTVDNQNSASHLKFWTGSQAQYNSLTPDPNTLYFII
jgi:hypothetical protein